MSNDPKILLFPRPLSDERALPSVDLVAAISDLIKCAGKVSEAANASDLSDRDKLEVLQIAKGIVSQGYFLYLIIAKEGDEMDDVRARIKTIIGDLARI